MATHGDVFGRKGIQLIAGRAVGVIAKRTPKRLIEQAKPGTLQTEYLGKWSGDHKGPVKPDRVNVPMSTPSCLVQPDTEAGKLRAKNNR